MDTTFLSRRRRGGVAEQITFGGEAQDLAGWPAENELLIISTGFSRTNNPQLVRVNPDTKESAPLPFDRAIEATKGRHGLLCLRAASSNERHEEVRGGVNNRGFGDGVRRIVKRQSSRRRMAGD